MTNENLKQKMSLIPKLPGCYLWKNQHNEVIYVGKAKNLFNRTHQYFDSYKTFKTNALVQEINDIDYIVVNSANEALILENNLIKKYWPKYNTLLKDSSEYPYIVVTNEKIPQILYTRHYNKVKGKYYGPLADTKFNRYELFKFLNELAPFKQHGALKGTKGWFYDFFVNHHSVTSLPSDDEVYQAWRQFIDDIFHGKTSDIVKSVNKMEELAVERWDFEHAEKYHNLAQTLTNLSTSQIVQLTKIEHSDYFCYYQQEDEIVFNVFNYLDGKLISKHNSIHKIYDDFNDVVVSAITQYYSTNFVPKKILVSLPHEYLEMLNKNFSTNFMLPVSKIDQEIMTIGIKNAKTYLTNHHLVLMKKLALTEYATQDLAKLLNLKSANWIEAFDNSNLNLQHAVSGMIVFKNGLPSKKDYRKYKLDETKLKSDFHYMQEVIYRRYHQLLTNNSKYPDLIIVDGGQIQVHAALISLSALGLQNIIPVIGLKKNQHHQTSCIVLSDGSEIELDKKSNVFLFLSHVQDEVHRFAINFYHNKHSNYNFKTFLDDIDGIGTKTKQKLFNAYPTLDLLKKANLNELQQIVSFKLAQKISEKLKELKD